VAPSVARKKNMLQKLSIGKMCIMKCI
jgi:hypothetical protein